QGNARTQRAVHQGLREGLGTPQGTGEKLSVEGPLIHPQASVMKQSDCHGKDPSQKIRQL
ncbi:MAG: hypothetical protein WA117_08305, partial [Verrucomicrobiia bacterium]